MVHKFHAGNHGQAAATDASFGRVLDSLAPTAPDSAGDSGDSSGGQDVADSMAVKDGQAGKSDPENAQGALVLALGAGISDLAKTKTLKDTASADNNDAKGASQAAQDGDDTPSAAPPSADSQSTDVADILAQLTMASATSDSKGAQAAKPGEDHDPPSAKPAEKTKAASPAQSAHASSSGKSEAGDPGIGAADLELDEILPQAATAGGPSQDTAAAAAEDTDSSKSATPSKAHQGKAQKEKDGAKDQTAAQPSALLVALPLPPAPGTAAPLPRPDANAKKKDDTIGQVSATGGDTSKKTTSSPAGRITDPSPKPSALAPGKAAAPVSLPNGQQQTGTGAATPAKAGASDDDHKSTPVQTGDKPGFAVLQTPAAQQKAPGAQDGSLLTQAPLPPQGASDAPSVTQHVQVVGSQPANIAALAIAIAAKSQSGNKEFDIRLDPPELGRVDVRLSIDQSGQAQANLSADQPRTLDLLRNDAPQLTRALRDAGLNMAQNGLNFSLRGQDRQNSNSNFSARNGRGSRALKAIAIAATGTVKGASHYQGPAQGRLDIRV